MQQQAFEVNNSNGVQEQKVQLESIIAEQEQSTSSNNASVENTEVVQSGSSSTQSEQTTTTSNENLSREVTCGHLERIQIPTFAGDKIKYQQWNAAFTSCVDKAMLTPQLKMLRLKACGEAADTVKGLGYSEKAYSAAQTRLERKYGGIRRQVQSHLEENAKELEVFADVLERAVICLEENGRQTDLEAGTLYTIVLEKIPEKLISQYYRWLREKQK